MEVYSSRKQALQAAAESVAGKQATTEMKLFGRDLRMLWEPRPSTPEIRSRFEPLGIPISLTFTIAGDEQAQPIRHTLAVIDGLHGDGRLPPLIAKREAAEGRIGQFVAGKGVLIDPKTRLAEFATAHELGHVLDIYGFTSGRSESLSGHEMMPLLNAWFASNAYHELQTLRARLSTASTDPARERNQRIECDKVNYLLRSDEFWSRAYAQWVAAFSQDPILLQQLETIRQDPGYSKFFVQWSDTDFARIDAEIHLLLKRKRWLR